MRHLLFMTVTFLLGFNTIDAKLSPIEERLVAPEWPDTPKGMNGPDSYMKEEMQECAKRYKESLKEVLSLKCTNQNLGYILAKIERHGFNIVNLSCGEGVEPMWVVNYSR